MREVFTFYYVSEEQAHRADEREKSHAASRGTGFCPKRRYIVELLNVGGNANNGANCGLAYSNSNNDFSNSRTNIGARLKLYTINKKNYTVQREIQGHAIEPTRRRAYR